MVPFHLEETSSAALRASGDSLLLDEVEARAAEAYALSWRGRLIRGIMWRIVSGSTEYETVERTIHVLRWAHHLSC